jgi:hypothetical protein
MLSSNVPHRYGIQKTALSSLHHQLHPSTLHTASSSTSAAAATSSYHHHHHPSSGSNTSLLNNSGLVGISGHYSNTTTIQQPGSPTSPPTMVLSKRSSPPSNSISPHMNEFNSQIEQIFKCFICLGKADSPHLCPFCSKIVCYDCIKVCVNVVVL